MTERRVLAGKQVDEWLEALASEAPTPGGVAFAALAASSGAALIAMVGRLTLRKRELEVVAPRMQEIVEEADGSRMVLLALADRDAEAFQDVLAAYGLPRETDEERTAWLHQLQEALEGSAEVALDLARRAVYLMGLAEDAVSMGNPNAIADAMSGAVALHAAALAAVTNVRVNAFAFLDETRRRELNETCDHLQERATAVLYDVQAAFDARIVPT